MCNCPSRTLPPLLPTEMPFPGVDGNREKLELWMRNRYAASAFNTCPHQPLQEMTGKPLDIVFVEVAVPVAVHTPVSIPHHWKAEVKAGLDQDVQLGIIEQVPAGTPTTWLSRMVVAPKNRGPTEGQQHHP